MAKVHYKWEPGGTPPKIQQHSVAKHEILRSYLVAYLQTLISSPNQDVFKVTLVDGFAGGGVYRHATTGAIVPGSPLVMLGAVEEATALVNLERSKPVVVDVDYVLVETDPGAYHVLRYELGQRGYGEQIDRRIFIRNSSFETEAEAIIRHIQAKTPRAARAIILLDQYGYSQVPTQLIARIFHALPGAEIILNFAVDSFLNYADGGAKSRQLLDKIGLPDVFRGRTLDDIKSFETDWRLFIQSTMYRDMVDACGARYHTTFFIRSSRGHGDYWLMHLSQRARARDVMTRIHWEKNNHFIHYGGAGLDMFRMLGYVTEKDSAFTGQSAFSFGFEFDDPAKAASVNALMEQIPRLIYPDVDGMTFGELFASTCNLSPADAGTYREAIGNLIAQKDLEVIGQDGTVRRSANIRDSDQIRAPRQRTFLF